ncbi:unnamed protein product, partial [Brenthis ino]
MLSNTSDSLEPLPPPPASGSATRVATLTPAAGTSGHSVRTKLAFIWSKFPATWRDVKQDARRKAAEAATAERAPRDIKRNAQINYLLAKHQSISEI